MIENAKQLARVCDEVCLLDTIYVLGGFGWPMNEENKARAKNAYPFNAREDRASAIDAASVNTFGFDCICFLKSVLWGFSGDPAKPYGGAVYGSNGVPDVDEKRMLELCSEISEDFSKVQIGEYLWTEGHCGIYLGGGVAVECTYNWRDGVQRTAVHNITGTVVNPGRFWRKHGKLPYVTYETEAAADYTLAFSNLRTGSRGEAVEAMQALLINRGYSCGPDGADGDFGKNTKKAVIAFQQDCEILPDGIAGRQTMSRLLGVSVT